MTKIKLICIEIRIFVLKTVYYLILKFPFFDQKTVLTSETLIREGKSYNSDRNI